MFNPIIGFITSLTKHILHVSNNNIKEKDENIFYRYDIDGTLHDLNLFDLFGKDFQSLDCFNNRYDIRDLVVKLLKILMESNSLLNDFNMNSLGYGTYLVTNLLEGKIITRKNIRRFENDIFHKKSIVSKRTSFLRSIKAHSKPSFCIAFDNNSKFIITVFLNFLLYRDQMIV